MREIVASLLQTVVFRMNEIRGGLLMYRFLTPTRFRPSNGMELSIRSHKSKPFDCCSVHLVLQSRGIIVLENFIISLVRLMDSSMISRLAKAFQEAKSKTNVGCIMIEHYSFNYNPSSLFPLNILFVPFFLYTANPPKPSNFLRLITYTLFPLNTIFK